MEAGGAPVSACSLHEARVLELVVIAQLLPTGDVCQCKYSHSGLTCKAQAFLGIDTASSQMEQ